METKGATPLEIWHQKINNIGTKIRDEKRHSHDFGLRTDRKLGYKTASEANLIVD